MNLESIDVESLRRALSSCKDILYYKDSQNIENSLKDSNIWDYNAKVNLDNALKKLIDANYKSLKVKLDKYFDLTNKIYEYQQLYNNNRDLKNLCDELSKLNNNLEVEINNFVRDNTRLSDEVNNLNGRLYKEEEYYYLDTESNEWKKADNTRKVKDTSVENEINEKLKDINFNNSKIVDMQSKINKNKYEINLNQNRIHENYKSMHDLEITISNAI